MNKAAALAVLKVSAAAADRCRPRQRGLVILIYHRVGGATGVQVDLPTELFERQIAMLAATGRVVDLDSALGILSSAGPDAGSDAAGSDEGVPGPADPVVVTFDDGTADFADVAVPVLVRHAVPATLYLATDFVERGRDFPDDGKPLSWGALGDVASTGLVTIGSHTHTHALLDRVGPEDAADELDRSIGLIEDRLGRRAHHFAYPKAVAGSPPAEDAVRRRFRSAALAGTRPNPYGADVHRLSRSPIQRADGMRWFTRKVEGGMALEDVVRQRLNRRRYEGATA